MNTYKSWWNNEIETISIRENKLIKSAMSNEENHFVLAGVKGMDTWVIVDGNRNQYGECLNLTGAKRMIEALKKVFPNTELWEEPVFNKAK